MQQYLPLAVLKHNAFNLTTNDSFVATVLTACGIETMIREVFQNSMDVATVLTACGIETMKPFTASSVPFLLQQYLPLAVLKRLLRLLPHLSLRCNSTYRLRY